MSELALKRIRESKEKGLTRLDLGHCGLTKLPDMGIKSKKLVEFSLQFDKKR